MLRGDLVRARDRRSGRPNGPGRPPNIVGNYAALGLELQRVRYCGRSAADRSSDYDRHDHRAGGRRFHGSTFDDGQGNDFLTFSGTVDDAGAITGTWDFTDIPEDIYINRVLTGMTAGGNIELNFAAVIQDASRAR